MLCSRCSSTAFSALLCRLGLCREAMEKLVDDGLVKHIGVSNFSTKQVEDLLEYARIKPVINQVELHPLLAQRKLVGVCARKVGGFVTAAEIDCGKQLTMCSSTSFCVLELAAPSPAYGMSTADASGCICTSWNLCASFQTLLVMRRCFWPASLMKSAIPSWVFVHQGGYARCVEPLTLMLHWCKSACCHVLAAWFGWHCSCTLHLAQKQKTLSQ